MKNLAASSPFARQAALGVALAIVYFATARLGLMLDAVAGFAALVWPPTGIALAALLLLGTRFWPAVALGAFAVNVSAGAAPLVAAGIAMGNTLEVVIGAELLRRSAFRPNLDRLRDVLAFVAAVVLATPVSATIGVLSLRAGGVVTAAAFWPAWRAWLLGDAIGALIVAPLLLVWTARVPKRPSAHNALEIAVLAMLVVGVALFVFAGPRLSGAAPLQQLYLQYPFLIWAALRFDQRGVVTAMFATSALAAWGATLGAGPFVGETLTARLMLLQAFMGVTAVTVYILGAAVCERRRAMQTQEEFLAIVSHDLRSPLTAIEMSASSILSKAEREGLSPFLQRRAEAIARACTRMAALIRDLVDLGAMQRGGLRVERNVVDVRRLFDEVVLQHQPLADQKQQTLTLELPNGTFDILADRMRVAQALSNIVSNAIKFTPDSGRIVVTCERDERIARFSVVDSGPGLEADQIAHLFEPYWQANPNAQGVGLGLAIAKGVVQAHGGEINAQRNEDGCGSTFTFTIPLAPPTGAEGRAPVASRAPSQP